MKILFTSFALLLFCLCSVAQKPKTPPPAPKVVVTPTLSKVDMQKIILMQDTLRRLSDMFVYDTLLAHRKQACYAFIPKLVNALKLDNSFYFPFDSLETVSKVYPKDSSFRILTWQLSLPGGHFRYYGVMQMRSTKTKIFPLYDMRDTLGYQSQMVTTNTNWYGSLYYNVIQKQVGQKAVYTLFGYEAADILTRRKVVDILTFTKEGTPTFGAAMFYFKYDSATGKKPDTLKRFFIEYKYNAPTVLNYDRSMDMIVFDHVAPPNAKAKGATFSYVPDGTYEGFQWANNRWNWVPTVFNFAINENDNPPIPAPLFGTPKRQPELPKEGDPR